MSYQAVTERHQYKDFSAPGSCFSSGRCTFVLRGRIMSSLLRSLQQSSRTVAVATLAALLAAWSPIAVFSQDGCCAAATCRSTDYAQPEFDHPRSQASRRSPRIARLDRDTDAAAAPSRRRCRTTRYRAIRQSVRIVEFSLFRRVLRLHSARYRGGNQSALHLRRSARCKHRTSATSRCTTISPPANNLRRPAATFC